jgi:hypothetical protein
MLRKLVLCAAISGVALLGFHSRSWTASAQSQSNQTGAQDQTQGKNQASKAISGKVASIGTGGHSFTLQVGNGGATDAQTVDFVVNENTQVQGQVKVGTLVTVEYQVIASGEKVALSVTAQG